MPSHIHDHCQPAHHPPGHDELPERLSNCVRETRMTLDECGDLLTIEEIAAVTMLGKTFLYESARSGWLRPMVVRFGCRAIRVPKSALVAYFQGGDHDAA